MLASLAVLVPSDARPRRPAWPSARAAASGGGDALRLNVSRTTTDKIHDGTTRLGRLPQPRGRAFLLPAGFCPSGDAAAECAASPTNLETHEPRS